jgi:hypothetical protein
MGVVEHRFSAMRFPVSVFIMSFSFNSFSWK